MKPTSNGFRRISVETLTLILDYLNLGDATMLAATDHYNQRGVSGYLVHRVQRAIAPFGITLYRMLHILDVTRSVISGSLIYKLLTNADFTPNDIDIYVPPSNSDYLLRLLHDEWGYTLERSTQSYLDNFAVSHVYWLRNTQQSVINVMVTKGENALEAIFYFHSTGVMNFLSSRGIFCPWPQLTLQCKSLENVDLYLRTAHGVDRGARLTSSFEKYRLRGVDIQRDLHRWNVFAGHICRVSSSCPAKLRSLHDAHGFFARFPRKTVDQLRYDNDKNDIIWCLGGPTCLQGGSYTPLLVHPFKSADVSLWFFFSLSLFPL